MVTNRQIGILTAVVVIAPLVVCVGLGAYINEPLGQEIHWVHVSGVQFEEGYLNITITNHDSHDYTINEVTIRQGYPHSLLADEIVNKPISGHETIQICINLNWTSSVKYAISIRTTDGDWDTWVALAP